MANVTPEDVGYIQTAEVIFNAAVSEYTQQRMAALINFFRATYVKEIEFPMNGYYRVFNAQNGVDGLWAFPYDAYITDLVCFAEVIGSGSQNEIDLKLSTAWNGSSFGAFSSVLTQTAITTTSAPANVSFGVGSTVTGTTAPVFSTYPYPVNQGDRLRIDCLSMMSGDGLNAKAIVRYIPRST